MRQTTQSAKKNVPTHRKLLLRIQTLPEIATRRSGVLVLVVGLLNKPHMLHRLPCPIYSSPVNYRNSLHSQREKQNQTPDQGSKDLEFFKSSLCQKLEKIQRSYNPCKLPFLLLFRVQLEWATLCKTLAWVTLNLNPTSTQFK